MTHNELKTLISKYDENIKAKLDQFSFEINFNNVAIQKNKFGLLELFDFLNEQFIGWTDFFKINGGINLLNHSFSFFEYTLTEYIKLISRIDNNNVENLQKEVINLFSNTSNVFTYNSKEINFLLNLYLSNGNSFEYAYSILISNPNLPFNWANNSDIVFGITNAFVFMGNKINLHSNNSEKNTIEIVEFLNQSNCFDLSP
jgi:hypothetical protein